MPDRIGNPFPRWLARRGSSKTHSEPAIKPRAAARVALARAIPIRARLLYLSHFAAIALKVRIALSEGCRVKKYPLADRGDYARAGEASRSI